MMKLVQVLTLLGALFLWDVRPTSATTVLAEPALMDVLVSDEENWEHLGGDPCNKNVQCTAKWAYETAAKEGVLPPSVAATAIADFQRADAQVASGEKPDWQDFQVCHGDVLATSFGEKHLRFVAVTHVLFEGCTAAVGWTIYDPESGKTFEVLRVKFCGNYSSREQKDVSSNLFGPPLLLNPPMPIVSTSFTSPPSTSVGGCLWCGGGTTHHPHVPSTPLGTSSIFLALALLSLMVVKQIRRREIRV